MFSIWFISRIKKKKSHIYSSNKNKRAFSVSIVRLSIPKKKENKFTRQNWSINHTLVLFNPVRFVIGDAVYLSSPDANEGDEYRIKWWDASSAEGSKFRKQVFGSVFVLKLPDDSRIWGSFLKLELVQKHSATHSANRNLFLFPAMHKTSGVFSIRIGEQANFFLTACFHF